MSLVLSSKNGFYISHESFINDIYNNMDPSYRLNSNLFKINSPFKTISKPKGRKEKCCNNEAQHVEILYKLFQEENKRAVETAEYGLNEDAIATARFAYIESGRNLPENIQGSNSERPCSVKLNNNTYLFPMNCKFYSKDIKDISLHLNLDEKYDLIVLDPPWWNKYIRRKRKYSESEGYNMMYNDDLKGIPLEDYLNNDTLVIIWCTNSPMHLTALKDEILPKWNLKLVSTWFWLKVTRNGLPVCPFSEQFGKQPYEKIIIAAPQGRTLPQVPADKIVVSIPSAIHSHKPPLIKLLEPFLPENPSCLEIFARYLLPGWTSYGLEVLRLQHLSLYEENRGQ